MIHSAEFKNNPKLYLFLPMYYLLWADLTVTPSEMKVMKKLLERQKWLSKEEKKFLLDKLNLSEFPGPNELKAWRKEIKNVKKNGYRSPIDLGIELVKQHTNGQPISFDGESIQSLQEAESELGLLSREVGYLFEQEHSTITSRYEARSVFGVESMQSILDGNQAGLIKKIKETISDQSFAYPEYESIKAQREQVFAWSKALAEQGFGSWAFPKAYGGKEDMEGYFTIMEALSYHDLSLVIKFGVQFGLWGMSIYFLGTEKHHQKYLKDIGTLELPGCFAMTETNHGSNVRGLETTATYNHQDQTFTINTPHKLARKEYIGNAAMHGQMATVFAKLMIDGEDFGVNTFVVPLRSKSGEIVKGVSIEDCGRKMGLNGVDNGLIGFNEVLIPKENMLDRFAKVNDAGEFESSISSDNKRFFTMLGTLVGGRIGIPRSALSAAKSGLTITIRYSNERMQFGPEGGKEVPILNYRMHQRRLMPPLAKSYALHFALKYVTERFLNKTEEEAKEIEALAAGIKAYTTWFTTATLQECREACGGKGYLSENRIDDLKNDSEIYTTFEGDNTVLMQLVAKSRLSEFKEEFSDMNIFTMFNYVVSQARTSVTEKNPIIVRSTDEEHLLDFDFHMKAFTFREREIVASSAKRLKRHIDEGMDSFDAFNVSQHHLVNVGLAYIERVVLEQFQLQINNTKDEGCKKVLTQLCQLYALHTIEQNKGWYLEQGYMEGVKTKAIRKTVNQLCWEIRQESIALTDAFGIPESCLAAPIAMRK
ncbi:acyl-CoA dehydrogenase family protein [Marivirga sp. S37H4]|uniref:acyl-CoA oxidase n=2 Tax=Marivirga aurantiaca TaxID=2802615 RepID=A0A935C6S9_9BACT|nr:acyl-CoA dehydrogenase family protein [Marivirga aurantiaca]